MNKREVLAKLISKCIDCIGEEECKRDVDIDQALTALNKLEKEKINGAYKQGYHDALNSRPYKVNL